MSKKKKQQALIRSVPFMLPSFVGMIIFSLLPIIISIFISLTDWNGLDKLNLNTLSQHFVGLKKLYQYPDNFRILEGTWTYAVLYRIVYSACFFGFAWNCGDFE